jgi:hypothetical protein
MPASVDVDVAEPVAQTDVSVDSNVGGWRPAAAVGDGDPTGPVVCEEGGDAEEENDDDDEGSEREPDCAWVSSSDAESEPGADDDGAEDDDSSAASSDWSDGGLWSDPDLSDDAHSSSGRSTNTGGSSDPTALLEAVRSGDALAVSRILQVGPNSNAWSQAPKPWLLNEP